MPLAPMSTAQFEVVCKSLSSKYPGEDGAGPIELWRQTERGSTPQEEIELLEASAAAAASVRSLWMAQLEASLEVLLGGNAQFTKLDELPTFDFDTVAAAATADSDGTASSARTAHTEL